MQKKPKKIVPENSFTEIILYTTPTGGVNVEIFLHNENIWLTQEKIALLFGVQRAAITKHLKNIFDSKELLENSVSSILEHTANDGKIYKTKFYNLDAIISVGYRVNSRQATLCRIWATERLREYIIKGYTMNDERLKDPRHIFGKDYFEEQLARIRDIRSSERRLYQKITDIYAQCSADADVGRIGNLHRIVQDYLIVRVAGLFDKRGGVISFEPWFKNNQVYKEIYQEQIIVDLIKLRHNFVAHNNQRNVDGNAFPETQQILNSNLKPLLLRLRKLLNSSKSLTV